MIFILNYDYNIIFDLNVSLCLLSQFYHTFLIGHLSSFLSQFLMQGKIYKRVILKCFLYRHWKIQDNNTQLW